MRIFISKTNLDYLHTYQARYGHNLPVCLLRSRTEPILASFVASLPQRASPLGLVVRCGWTPATREGKRERERKGNIRFSYPSHDSTSHVSIVTVVLSSTKQSIPSSHHPIILSSQYPNHPIIIIPSLSQVTTSTFVLCTTWRDLRQPSVRKGEKSRKGKDRHHHASWSLFLSSARQQAWINELPINYLSLAELRIYVQPRREREKWWMAPPRPITGGNGKGEKATIRHWSREVSNFNNNNILIFLLFFFSTTSSPNVSECYGMMQGRPEVGNWWYCIYCASTHQRKWAGWMIITRLAHWPLASLRV